MSYAYCTCCYNKGLECKLLSGSQKCKECYCSYVSCVINPPSKGEQNLLKRAKNKLKNDLLEASLIQQEAFQTLIKANA